MLNQLTTPLLALPRLAKRLLAIGVDVVLCALAVWLALCLRLESWVLMHGNQWIAVGLSVAIAIPIFGISGLYRAIFRYAGMAALNAVAKSVFVYGVVYATLLMALALPGVPRTVGILQPLLLLLLVGGSRALGR